MIRRIVNQHVLDRLTTGLEEATAVVREAGGNATAERNRLVSVAMENRVLILGPQAIGALTAFSRLVPTDGSSIPVVVVVENRRQAKRVKA